jgi:predicted nucleic acid-binding protein
VERIEAIPHFARTDVAAAQAGQFSIVSSDLVVLETLVKPLREGDTVVELLFRSLFEASEVRLIPATRPLWEEAARLRAETGLKTPDALHAAAALHAGCTIFITNGDDFRRLKELPVVVLDDLFREENQV